MFPESRVFRIDHFLGKESVDNILALRFANGMFEPVWNRNHIDHVQIDVPETLAVGSRGAFQAVEDQEDRRVRPHLTDRPVEVDEVVVRCGDPLPAPPQPVAPDERAPDRLDVAVPAPPGWPERGRYACPISSSFTISGTISLARRSSSASVRFAIGCGIIRNL